MPELRTFRSEIDHEFIREDFFMGKKHLVVPVVALVQGVLHAANAAEPELALAQDFGKVPPGWDGRPLVMNHPSVDGSPVHANAPDILEEWSFGQIFNAHVEDNKLKVEAWIDLERVDFMGGEVAQTVERINNGDVVEVSTGFFADVQTLSGTYGGKKYFGIYRNFIPDHLAFLSDGVLGACSVEGGCGAPRVHIEGRPELYGVPAGIPEDYDPFTPSKPFDPTGAKPEGECECEGEGQCQCDKTVQDNAKGKPKPKPKPKPKGYNGMSALALYKRLSSIVAASLPDGMLSEDARRILSDAVRKLYGTWSYLIAFTNSHAIYQDFETGSIFQVPYTMDADGHVTFTGETEEVNLITRVVPVTSSSGAGVEPAVVASSPLPAEPSTPTPEVLTAEAPASEEPATTNKEVNVTNPTTEQPRSEPATEPVVTAAAEPAPASEPATTPEIKTPTTLEEFVSSAPNAAWTAELTEGLRIHNERKQTVITALKATNRCDVPDDELNVMSLQGLERLAKLAGVDAAKPAEEPAAPADFSARPAPAPTTAKSNEEERFAPMPTPLFPAKKEAA